MTTHRSAYRAITASIYESLADQPYDPNGFTEFHETARFLSGSIEEFMENDIEAEDLKTIFARHPEIDLTKHIISLIEDGLVDREVLDMLKE